MMRVRAPVSLVLLVAAIGLLLCIDNVDSGPVAAASRYYGEGRPSHPYFWEVLMNNPAGVAGCGKSNGESCRSGRECCSETCTLGAVAADEYACCEANALPVLDACGNDDQCCTSHCGRAANQTAGYCCTPDKLNDYELGCRINGTRYGDLCCSGYCSSYGNCAQSCFAGDTRVRVRGAAQPVAIRDLKTGDYVMCLNTTDDLREATTTTWCEVKNWLNADQLTFLQTQYSFTYPAGAGKRAGTSGSLTLSSTHMFMKLTAAQAGDTAASVQDFGAFELIEAASIKAGDLFPVLTDPDNPSAGFTAVAVTAAGPVEAEGMYLPMIERPYIVVEDSIVAPLIIYSRSKIVAPANAYGAQQATSFYRYAPLWTQMLQAVGTSGLNGGWCDEQTGVCGPKWPGIARQQKAQRPHREAGEQLSYEVFNAWIEPKIRAWEADPSKVIDEQTILNYLASAAPWVKPAARGDGRGEEEPEEDMSTVLNSW